MRLLQARSNVCKREAVASWEAAVPGLTEKLAVVQQGRAFASEIEPLEATEISRTTLGDADYLRPYAGSLNRRRYSISGGRSDTKTVWRWRWWGTQAEPLRPLAAQRLSADLAQNGFTVVSGLARGIDSLAHQGALQAGGLTIAVLGSGINVIYPPEHRRFMRRSVPGGSGLGVSLRYQTRSLEFSAP